MRDFSFRAWNKTHSTMSGQFSFEEFDGDFFKPNSWPTDEMIIMQYIGLKGKNNTDICEGDIIADSTSGFLGVLEWSTDSHPEFILKTVKGVMTGVIAYENVEIVGNIYENPELLEEDAKTKE